LTQSFKSKKMAAPVNVVIPAGAAPDNPIFVDANDAVVTGLPWLPWELAAAMGGLPRVSIKLSEALAAFAVKCKLSRTPADMVAMGPIDPLTLKLTAGAWSRILTAVRDSGLALLTIHVVGQLHDYIKANVPVVPIAAADWQAAAPLVVGGNAAARAAATRFLGLANIGSLEVPVSRTTRLRGGESTIHRGGLGGSRWTVDSSVDW
jgi:hypothetical protein